jgi:hypothetical protein
LLLFSIVAENVRFFIPRVPATIQATMLEGKTTERREYCNEQNTTPKEPSQPDVQVVARYEPSDKAAMVNALLLLFELTGRL